MAGGMHVRPSFVNRAMDRESGGIDGLITMYNSAALVDKDEIRDTDL